MSMNRLSGRIRAIAAAFALVMALALSGCAEIADAQVPLAPAPLIYSEGGQVYMACGENSVCLSGVQVVEEDEDKTIRAEISEDNSTLIYISDYDDSTGAGTLMGAHTDCLMEPYRIDTGVYAAEISADGERVLLIKNVSDGTGDLYLVKGAGKPQYITGGVSRENLGFSPDGKTISYEKERRLFIREEGREALEAADATKAGSFYVMNGGRLLYQTSYYIYFFSDGVTEVEAEDAVLLKVQRGTDTFLYQTDEGLFSKQPGREAKLLIEDSRGIEIVLEYQYTGSLYHSFADNYYDATFLGDGFLVIERDYRDRQTKTSIYEQEIGNDRVKIAGPDYSAVMDHRMTNVIFTKYEEDGDKTYLCTKSSRGWSKAKMILDFPFTIFHGDCPEFDNADQYLYCLEHDDFNRAEGGFLRYDVEGSFWRYDIEKGKAEELMEGATGFFLINNVPYVYTEDAIWKVWSNGDKVKIVDRATDRHEDLFFETDGGAFFVTAANDIYYIKDEETEMSKVCRADWYIEPAYGLRFISI